MLKIFRTALHYWDYKEKKLNFIANYLIPFRFAIEEKGGF